MNTRKPKSRPLPIAVTGRRLFFVNRFDDIQLITGEIVVVPSAVTTVSSKRFADHVFALVPKDKWITFLSQGVVNTAPTQAAFMNALTKIWPRTDDLDPDLDDVANELLHEFIKLLTTRAPGAIAEVFAESGITFGPVPK